MSPEEKGDCPSKAVGFGGAIALVIYSFPEVDKKRDGFL